MESSPASPRIHRLPPQVANQIAAGEVVERPASVAKELLENSLDAGARRIDIEVEQGGVKLLRVRDDGCGIHPEDLALALSPHATSKITRHEDLLGIASLGFRGEALASIASVSRFTLTSRRADQESGWRITQNQAPVPAAHPPGTTVEMRDLFYNVPARRKFLRAERTEFIHVEDVVKRAALGRFDVAVNLRHNGRSVLTLPPALDSAARQQRLRAVVGGQFAGQALAVSLEAAGLRLSGWLAGPGYSRSQADLQFFFLNGRMIRDKLVNHAIRQACSDFLEPGRYLAYVLYLEMDPRQVDVNVHPTKHEVRFRESRLVHDFLHRAAREALAGGNPALDLAGAEPEVPPPQPERGASAPRPQPAPGRDGDRRPAPEGRRPLFPDRPGGSVRDTLAAYRTLGAEAPGRRESATYLGMIDGRYILGRTTAGFVLVDGLRHERRRLHAHLMQALEEGEIRSRPLLVPAPLELRPDWGDLSTARSYGVEIERLGPDTAVLRRVPAVMKSDAGAPVLAGELLALLGREQVAPAKVLDVVAEHAAGPLDPETGRRLLAAQARGELEPDLWRPLDGSAAALLFGEPDS